MREHRHVLGVGDLVRGKVQCGVRDRRDDAAVAVQIGDAAVRGDDGGLLNVGDRVVHAAAETAVDMEFTRPMPPAHFECGKHVGVVLLGREPECAHTGIAGGFRREILGGIEVADDHVDMHAEFARMGIAAVRRHDERMLWQRIWARVILAGAENDADSGCGVRGDPLRLACRRLALPCYAYDSCTHGNAGEG